VDGPPPSAGNYPGMPNFVLGYGGTAGGVTIGSNNQVGAYWAADTQSAFTALQAELAAYYDANPLLEEVTVETCASVGGEPYIEATDITSLTTLRGLTDTAYNDTNRKACFTAAASAYSAWTTTAIDSDYNQFLGTDGCTTAHPTSCVVKDPVFTTTTMAAFAAPSGVRNSRLLVANHDLPAAGYPITGGLATFYPEFNTLGSPVELQTTVGLNGVGACQALQLGVQYSMTEMEIHQTEDAPNGAQGSSATILDDAQLAALKGLLAARDHTSNCNLTSVMPAYIAGT